MSAVLTQIERGVAMEKDLSISNFTEIVNIIETAKNMLKKNCDINLISEVTNLTISEIKKLV